MHKRFLLPFLQPSSKNVLRFCSKYGGRGGGGGCQLPPSVSIPELHMLGSTLFRKVVQTYTWLSHPICIVAD